MLWHTALVDEIHTSSVSHLMLEMTAVSMHQTEHIEKRRGRQPTAASWAEQMRISERADGMMQHAA